MKIRQHLKRRFAGKTGQSPNIPDEAARGDLACPARIGAIMNACETKQARMANLSPYDRRERNNFVRFMTAYCMDYHIHNSDSVTNPGLAWTWQFCKGHRAKCTVFHLMFRSWSRRPSVSFLYSLIRVKSLMLRTPLRIQAIHAAWNLAPSRYSA